MKELENKDLTNLRPDYENEIILLVRNRSLTPNALKKELENYHENDIAEVLTLLNGNEQKRILKALDMEFFANIFEYLEPEEAAKYLNDMPIIKAAKILEKMESDDAHLILNQLSKEKRDDIIYSMDEEAKRDLDIIAAYKEDEIGSRMTSNYIVINQGLSVKEAMHELVDQAATNDNISTIFVENEDKVFHGAIDLKDLIVAREGSDLNTLIKTSYPYVYGSEPIDDVIEDLKDYSEDLIPILDNNNHIQGVMTSQNVIQVVDDVMGEDYAQFAGLTAEEDLKEPLLESMKKRLPWLLALLALGMVVSSVVGVFEGVVAQLTIIMSFQSLILDMAGNVGTQSLAVTIRVLTDENLTAKQKLHLVFKETKVGLFNGLLLGIISVIIVGLYIFFMKERTLLDSFLISGCIGVSLLVAMVVSSLAGTVIPIFFKKIKVDPAVASGPLITTVNDLIAVVTYYGLSWILLLQVFHLTS